MGLIKSAVKSVSSTLRDQWKEVIRCDDMTNDMLMVRKTTPTGVISNGSIIVVAPGQCAIIYDNGRIIDATAEDGVYIFDTSSMPSFFAGQFKDSFKEMWTRFTYNGATSKEQSVYFFNLKEIMDNKFGTSTPIPFQDWSHPIQNRMINSISPLSVKVRCYGTYTFKLNNPAIFMQELAGTVNVYYKSSVVEQIRSEVIAAFQNVLNELGTSKYKVPVLEMPSQTDEITQIMEERVFDEPIRRRGIKLVSFSVESVTLDEDSEKKINEYELGSNAYMQQGRMTSAYSNAVESAAQNANGSASGFMGIGMMNMASGGAMGGTAVGPWQNQNEQNSSQSYNPYERQNEQSNSQNHNVNMNANQQSESQSDNQNMNANQQSESQSDNQNMNANQQNEPQSDNQNMNVNEQSNSQNYNSNMNANQQSGSQNYNSNMNINQQNDSQNYSSNENINQQNIVQDNNLAERQQEEDKKTCPNCGNLNPQGAKFCNNCGKRL